MVIGEDEEEGNPRLWGTGEVLRFGIATDGKRRAWAVCLGGPTEANVAVFFCGESHT